MPDSRITTIRWPADWYERMAELSEHYGVAQWIRAILYPILGGWLKPEFDEQGNLVRLVGRDAGGRKAELVIDGGRRPVVRLEPVSEPPRMGRPRQDS